MKEHIQQSLQRFLKTLEMKRPGTWKLIQGAKSPPASVFQDFERTYGFSLPEDLRTLYQTINGYQPGDYSEEKEFVPGLYLLPFIEALRLYESSYFGPEHNRVEWIVLSDCGSKVIFRKVVSCDVDDQSLYIRTADLQDWRIYDGIPEMFDTMTACLEIGAYESCSAKDEIAIGLKCNPKSRYWQESALLLGVTAKQ